MGLLLLCFTVGAAVVGLQWVVCIGGVDIGRAGYARRAAGSRCSGTLEHRYPGMGSPGKSPAVASCPQLLWGEMRRKCDAVPE